MTLQFDNRYFELTRSYAVKNWQDAAIELITNACDSYIRQGLSEGQTGDIKITLLNNRKTIAFLDYGIGMNTEEAKYNLLNVGTSTEDSSETRGYFNRGAKDVTAVGKVSYWCLKDGDWIKIVLHPNLSVDITEKADLPAQDITNIFGTETSGVYVELELLDPYKVDSQLLLSEVCTQFCNLFQLRSVLSDDRYVFTLTEGTETISIKYVHPTATQVDQLIYRVPGYEHIEAVYQLFMTNTEIPHIVDKRSQIRGILVRSVKTDYDITFFNSSIMANEYNGYFYGFLTTDGIATMLSDFEETGPTDANPQLILDPSRGSVNVDHPFIRQLYSVPQLRLKTAIEMREVDDFTARGNTVVEGENLVLDNLESVANTIVKTTLPNFFIHNEHVNKLALAFEDINKNYALSTLTPVDADVQLADTFEYTVPGVANEIQRLYSNEIPQEQAVLKDILYGELKEDDGTVELTSVDKYVFAKEGAETKVKIKFARFDSPKEQYKVFLGNYLITINVNLTNPLIASVFTEGNDGEIDGLETTQGKLILSDIVSDALSWLYIEETSKSNTEREYSLLDGILYGKKMHMDKRDNIKTKMLSSVIGDP